jgi:hypothetical protein
MEIHIDPSVIRVRKKVMNIAIEKRPIRNVRYCPTKRYNTTWPEKAFIVSVTI